MRLIVARCEVVYTGRLVQALLPEALRLIMVKSDGSVMVHADTAAHPRLPRRVQPEGLARPRRRADNLHPGAR